MKRFSKSSSSKKVSDERRIVIIVRKTRLEELLYKYNTIAQSKFYIEHLGGDFSDYENEHSQYHYAVNEAIKILECVGRVHKVDRSFLPNYIFGKEDIVVAIGQDGLVANTIKYLDGHKLLGVNPDPDRWDGVLLPFSIESLAQGITKALEVGCDVKFVTLAKVELNTGQILYGVNDIFIGPKTHQSLRYTITHHKQSEHQSSSGIIISTGLGSTGWFTSLMVGANQIANPKALQEDYSFAWDSNYLYFTVREPFPSKYSQVNIIFGQVSSEKELMIESLMPENGVIFSDGIEKDFLEFNSGTTAKISIAKKKGCLVV
ncbi:MAG: sugar kinase [Campylobacterota bacterium]|nr:sugar kinase [Campylobacterota bacterium]